MKKIRMIPFSKIHMSSDRYSQVSFSPLTHTNRTKSHLDWEHCDALWAVDTVPNTEATPVLGNHHITARHPLDIRAETQQSGLYTGLYVIQMELGGMGSVAQSEILNIIITDGLTLSDAMCIHTVVKAEGHISGNMLQDQYNSHTVPFNLIWISS